MLHAHQNHSLGIPKYCKIHINKHNAVVSWTKLTDA